MTPSTAGSAAKRSRLSGNSAKPAVQKAETLWKIADQAGSATPRATNSG
jgi:hypothetical protein